MTITVAYQGERGAFSEAAARRLLGTDIDTMACASFEEMFDAVEGSRALCGVAPIENSLAGSIHRNYDLLLGSRLRIAGETHLRVMHNLIAPPDVQLGAVRRIYSHPVALAQCTRFLRANPTAEPVAVPDTAGAVRDVMERSNGEEAAIASADAAAIYGGKILAGSLEDHPENYTRFLLITASPEAIETKEAMRRWKTSIVFRIGNRPGALFRALGAFAMFDIDLAKIESRPIEGHPWEYAFYLDVVGREGEAPVARALDNLREMAEMVRVLGSYPTKW